MRQIVKSFSYILIVGFISWSAAYITDFFIGSVRFTAADRAPGDLTSQEEWVAFLYATFSISVCIGIIGVFYGLIGKKLHPAILYGVPFFAILYYAVRTFYATVGYSV